MDAKYKTPDDFGVPLKTPMSSIRLKRADNNNKLVITIKLLILPVLKVHQSIDT